MADKVTISLLATTMEGTPALDPAVTVEVREVSPIPRPVSNALIKSFNGAANVSLAMPAGFPNWQVNVSFSRYDTVTGFIFQPKGNANPQFTMHLTRLPAKWTPRFTPLAALAPARFTPFSAVVAVSHNVDLKANGAPPAGDLSVTYDGLANPAQIQGKMALLNLFSVLTEERDPVGNVPWFSYVRKIVRIDQERFIAEVTAELFENVQTILNGLNGAFKGQGFFTEPSLDQMLHTGNIPPQYDVDNNLQQMITLKKDYEQGNVQLTLSYLVVGGAAVHLLDCDMDENRNLVLHSLDLGKHLLNGGTSPVTMHEYIEKDSADQAADGIATVDLGYRLE